MDGIVAALIGRLGQDAELKYLDNGTAALKLSLAVFDAKAAERGDPLQWVRCTVWGQRAEELGESLKKGAEVYIEGRLRLSRWTAQAAAAHRGRGACRVIGDAPVPVELLQGVPSAVPGSSKQPRGVIATGTRGWASRLYPRSDLALFTADSGERAVVPLVHLRELDDRTVAGDGGS